MMQSAKFWERDHGPFRWRLHASRRGRVLLQGEMCARPMIVGEICGQEPAQMPLADHDHVVQALAPKEPITRSTYGFCHGLEGLDTTSSMPMLAIRRRNAAP